MLLCGDRASAGRSGPGVQKVPLLPAGAVGVQVLIQQVLLVFDFSVFLFFSSLSVILMLKEMFCQGF